MYEKKLERIFASIKIACNNRNFVFNDKLQMKTDISTLFDPTLRVVTAMDTSK